TIGGHFFITQLSEDTFRQYSFDEIILVEHQMFTLARSQRAEHLIATGGKVCPAPRLRNCLHVGNRLDLLRMAEQTIEAQRRAPIMKHERDLLGKPQRLEPMI